MRDIFSEFYNKVLGFFRQTEEEDKTKDVACNRLRVVLMQDRTNLNPQLLERMRGEIVDLLSKYVEMDREALDLNFEQEGEQIALMLSIPVVRAKEEAEIEATLKAEDEKKAALEAIDKEDSEAEAETDEVQEEEESEDSDATDVADEEKSEDGATEEPKTTEEIKKPKLKKFEKSE